MSFLELLSIAKQEMSKARPKATVRHLERIDLSINSDSTSNVPSPKMSYPHLGLVLQGRQEIKTDTENIKIEPGTAFILDPSELAKNQLRNRCAQKGPYLVLMTPINPTVLRQLLVEHDRQIQGIRSDIGDSKELDDTCLYEPLLRMLLINQSPLEAEILGPSIERELYFRLLCSRHSQKLRQLVSKDGTSNRMLDTIQYIKAHFREPMDMNYLASTSAMSLSTFFLKFKEVTNKSPLQYQKELRLNEAYRLLNSGEGSVTEIAFKIGYNSVSQFSREFKRQFAFSPSSCASKVR